MFCTYLLVLHISNAVYYAFSAQVNLHLSGPLPRSPFQRHLPYDPTALLTRPPVQRHASVPGPIGGWFCRRLRTSLPLPEQQPRARLHDASVRFPIRVQDACCPCGPELFGWSLAHER